MRRRRRAWTLAGIALFMLLVGGSLAVLVRAWQREQATHDLAVAVYANSTIDAELALRRGADPNTRQLPSEEPPTLAQFVRRLFASLKKRDSKSGSDHRPSMVALAAAKALEAEDKRSKLVATPLNYGANPNVHTTYADGEEHYAEDNDATSGRTTLMMAAMNDDVDMVRTLLEHGASVEAGDAWGDAPLLLTGQTTIIKMLLEHGANVYVEKESGKYYGESALCLHSFNRANFELFLKHGADINHCDRWRGTPLINAALYGESRDLEYILSRGARTDIRNKDGWDALTFAIEDGRTNNVKVLLAHGVDPNKRDKDRETPLFTAVRHGEDGPVKALLAAGARVNVKNKKGITPLQLAEEDEDGGNDSVEDMLRAAGAIDY